MLKKIKGVFGFGCMIFGLIFVLSGSISSVCAAEKAAQPVHMKFSNFLGPAHLLSPQLMEYARQLTEASKGTVILDYYGAEALGKSTEHWDIAVEGLADQSFFCCIYTPARFPLSMFVELPFITTSGRKSMKLAQALLKRNLINDEYKEVRLMSPSISAPVQILSNKKISKMEDFKGLRVTGMGPVWTRTWALLGAQSFAIGWPDIYLALDRGTIDAGTASWASSKGLKWQEVAKHGVDISMMGGFFCGVIMNKNSWNKLSADVQAAWTDVSNKFSMRFSGAYDDADEDGKEAFKAAGVEIYEFPLTEKERLAKKLLPVWQDWIDRNEKAGKPAKEIYKTYVEVMKGEGEPVIMKIPGLYHD